MSHEAEVKPRPGHTQCCFGAVLCTCPALSRRIVTSQPQVQNMARFTEAAQDFYELPLEKEKPPEFVSVLVCHLVAV